MPLRGRLLMAGVTAACGMGFLLFGYDQGVLGGVINSKTFVEEFDHPSSTMQDIITGMYDVGCLLGSIATFLFSEPIGRKNSMYIGAVWALVGTIVQTTAYTSGHLIAGRVVTGVGIGIKTAIVPTWQAEVSPAHKRGPLVTIQAACIIAGFALSNWVCLGSSYASSSLQWRFPIAMQAIFPLYTLLTVPFLVESPRWLANHKGLDAATSVIARLNDAPLDDPDVLSVRREIEAALEEEKSNMTWYTIFTNSGEQNFRRLSLGVVVLYMQQMCGINSIGYYLPVIFEEYLGFTSEMSLILAAIGATQYILFAFAPIWFIERVGRRKCMLWGAVVLAICSALIGVGLKLDTKASLGMAVAFYFLFYDTFGMSYLNVPWLYAPEINSLKMRVKGTAAASASNWLFNGIVVTVTPIGLDHIGWKFYMIFLALNLSFVPIVYFCYPETKGLSLEKIDHIFIGGDARGWRCLTQGVRESVKAAEGTHLFPDDEESTTDSTGQDKKNAKTYVHAEHA